ncbi:MAG: transglutaminase domain-containing protein [Oscillospiraceae bacterium]|nr:transglutaminase domain-containing protein [Oscillospiraceae bacterium]
MQLRYRKLISLLLCAVVAFAAAGCGESSAPPDSGSQNPGSSSQTAEVPDTVYEIPPYRDSVFVEENAEGNDEVKIDLSNTADGYVAVVCDSDARLKLQVVKDDVTYTYDVVQRKVQIYPLQSGNGHYTVKVMKNIEDSKYFELYKCETDVVLNSDFEPYLRTNQYAEYTEQSQCVVIAHEFASSAYSANDFISKVYEYVCDNVTYDYEKAATVASGYIPDPDRTLSEKKGICIDYACLAASMLRSQGIPTKIIFGYVAPDDIYHAWNMFYTEESGWVTVEFKANGNDWTRLDLTFSANGEDSTFIGDGSNYLDVYQF